MSPPVVGLALLSTTPCIFPGATNAPVLLAQASDAYGAIGQIQFVNGLDLNTKISAGTATNLWAPTFPGTYSLAALATDTLGNSRYSGVVSITVYLDSNGDGVPDYLQVLQGNDPLNPWIPPSGETNSTPPEINLVTPANATLLP
jgi:hypothetical protein